MMMKLKQLFGIRREERWHVLVMVVAAVALNVVFSSRLYPFLTTTMNPDEQGEKLLQLFHILVVQLLMMVVLGVDMV